jgi:hypothetical protein
MRRGKIISKPGRAWTVSSTGRRLASSLREVGDVVDGTAGQAFETGKRDVGESSRCVFALQAGDASEPIADKFGAVLVGGSGEVAEFARDSGIKADCY